MCGLPVALGGVRSERLSLRALSCWTPKISTSCGTRGRRVYRRVRVCMTGGPQSPREQTLGSELLQGGEGRAGQGRAGEGRGVCGSYEGDVSAPTERQGRGTLCPGPYPLLATQMCIPTPSSRTLHPIPHPVWVAAGGSVLDSLAAVVPPVATGASPEYAARAGALEALVGEAAGLGWPGPDFTPLSCSSPPPPI